MQLLQSNKAVSLTPSGGGKRITALFLVLGLLTISTGSLPAQANPRSAIRTLQQQIQAPVVFLPNQLYLGQSVPFQCKAAPGTVVVLYYAPHPMNSPEQVTEKTPSVTGTVPASGLLVLNFPVPNEKALLGQTVFFYATVLKPGQVPSRATTEASQENAIQALEVSEAEQAASSGVQWREAGGKAVQAPSLTIVAVEEAKAGPRIMPLMPGIDPSMMRQLEQATDLSTTTDARRKQLIYDGSINRERQLDRNVLIPGASSSGRTGF